MAETPSAPLTENFEAALTELETIIAAMERGDLPLEQALDSYQRGMALLRHCQATLNAADTRIRVLEEQQLVNLEPEE